MGALQIKGVVVVALVDVILADRARYEPHVPDALRKYLEDLPYAGEWYPVLDVVGLCEAVRLAQWPEMDRREAFERMGAITVQRDAFGVRELMMSDAAREKGGAFEGAFRADLDLATFIRRGLALWQVYYDQGENFCTRAGERALAVRLVGVKSPAEELCWMTAGSYRAMVSARNVVAEVEHTTCSARGHDACRWKLTYPETLEPRALDAFGLWDEGRS